MSMKEMNALTMADDLVEFLGDHPGYLAHVHSVFPHAVNLLVGEDVLITLTNQDDITPMGLIADSSMSFKQYLQTGDEVIVDLHQFTALNGVFTLNLRGAQVWKSEISTNLNPRLLNEVDRITLQLTEWLVKQPVLGLLPLLPRLTHQAANSQQANDNIYSRYIADDLEAFANAIAASDWELALDLTDRLVGFGMGSTPSCDDFLAAYLVVFKLAEALNPASFPWVSEFNNAIANQARQRTTLMSANMLRHAADGKISGSHQRLIQTCLFDNKSDLVDSADRVIQHGATSGGDFLLGLVCVLEWYRNTMMDFTKKGEQAWVESKRLQPVPII